MKSACITILAVCLVFAAGAVTGRIVQLGYDRPAMKTEAEANRLRLTDGCTFTRSIGGDGSFLNFVCAARKPTGMIR
ncbi:hypothetical protein FIU28_17410 [Tardiphaga sp. vice154]|uniref:hypothetical protein n=1 Tax=Tardiphaga sp. vice154 TaxID=2592814 RepID=UPI00116582E9|nr:hypothetical protein [Tardiphaga sp. vice154]QDM22730.1 hypothetical protein FIU28_17410 [Tardiphaga sp. vice154]